MSRPRPVPNHRALLTLLVALALVGLSGVLRTSPVDAATNTGGVQVVKTVCLTSEANHDTTFSVNQPKSTGRPAMEQVSGCARGANGVYRLTSVQRTDFIDLTTGADGEASANRLAPGPYTLTEMATGSSTSFDVMDGRSTVISVTNFDYPASGTLEIVSLNCPGQDGPFVTVNWPNTTPPGDPNGTVSQAAGGCQFGKMALSIADAHGNTIWETTTEPSGLAVVDLPPGNYTVAVSEPNAIAATGIVAVDQNTKVILTNPVA
jgi:hypothetical protein